MYIVEVRVAPLIIIWKMWRERNYGVSPNNLFILRIQGYSVRVRSKVKYVENFFGHISVSSCVLGV